VTVTRASAIFAVPILAVLRSSAICCAQTKEGDTVTFIEYEIELERADGKTDYTSAILPPQLTKGQRLKVPVDDGWIDAEVIEVTRLVSNEPIKWKLIARELRLPLQP
jgi:hypothetical protein